MFGGLALTCWFAAAADPGLVLILQPPEVASVQRELVHRVRGELKESGAHVEVREQAPAAEHDLRAQLQVAAAERNAEASFAIVTKAPGKLEIWIWHSRAQRFVFKDLHAADARAPSWLAVRAVEVLRANVEALALRHPRDDVGDATAVRAAGTQAAQGLPPSSTKRSVALAGVWYARSRAPTSSFLPALSYAHTGDRFGLELSFAGFGPPVTVAGTAGSSSLRQAAITAGLLIHIARVGGVRLHTVIASGLYHVSSDGKGVGSYAGRGGEAYAGVAEAGLRATYAVIPHLSLRLNLGGQALWPPVRYRAADAEVGRADWRTLRLEVGTQVDF